MGSVLHLVKHKKINWSSNSRWNYLWDWGSRHKSMTPNKTYASKYPSSMCIKNVDR